MAFDVREQSIEQGQPNRLYRFTLGSAVWRLAATDDDVTLGGYTFTAVAISDGGTSQTGESQTDTLSITIPDSVNPAALFKAQPPEQPIRVEILRYHEGDTEAVVCYLGEILQVNFVAPGVASLECMTLSATMQREGLRLGWQRTCPYALYDPLTCKVDKAEWSLGRTVLAKTAATITVSTTDMMPASRYNGGFIEWTDPDRGVMRRTIESMTGAVMTLFGTTSGLDVGTAIIVYPGCARTIVACQQFDNILNYGGHPSMPGKSPFDGDPVF